MLRPSRHRGRSWVTTLVAAALLTSPVPAAAGATPGAVADRVTSAAAPAAPAPAAPEPQAPVVQEVPLVVPDDAPAGAPAGAAAAADDVDDVRPAEGSAVVADVPLPAGRVATEALRTGDDQTIGVTWPDGADEDALAVQVRTRTGEAWSAWQELDAGGTPDAGTADAERARRGGTETFWVGDADAVQLSFDATGETPADVRLALVGTPDQEDSAAARRTPAPAPSASASVDPTPTATPSVTPTASPAASPTAAPTPDAGRSTADAGRTTRTSRATVRTAVADTTVTAATAVPAAGALRTASSPPRVISRAEWGAPAQVCTPDLASGLVGAVVHHTAGSNAYSSVAEAMQQMRNDAAYHIQSRGWCDIGYNFIVDKWGNIYEGRAGSMALPVIGVHAGGFNTQTLGVSMLGTYDSVPPEAMQRAVGQIIGWRLGQYGVDPRGSLTYYTGNGENSRFQNQWVTLPRVFGHRDVAYTACPGNGGYATLPTIRQVAYEWSLLGRESPASSLMRTAESATVYLVSGGKRYPIDSLAVMSALSPLGPVAVVTGGYMDRWPVGQVVRRAILSPNGTVSFFDAGIRLSFTSCSQVTDYGMSCGDAVPLDAAQIGRLHDGGSMANVYRTTSGKAFWVRDGARREIADAESARLAGAPTASVTLLESGVSYLPYGDPVVRPGLVVRERGGARAVIVGSTQSIAMPAALSAVPGLGSGTTAQLDAGSIARVRTDVTLAPFVTEQGSGTTYLLTDAGKARVTGSGVAPSGRPEVPASVLQGVPTAATVTDRLFLKSSSATTVYSVRAGSLSRIRAWDDLVHLNGGPDGLTIRVTTPEIVGLLPVGEPYDAPGTLVYTPSDGTVYLVDGESHRVAVSTFATTGELGATRLSSVSPAALAARTARTGVLRTTVTCGTRTYIGLGGALYEISSAARAHYSLTATVLDPVTCSQLPQSTRALTRFLRTPDGTIYWVESGTKRPIGSWQRYLQLSGSADAAIAVSAYGAAQLPTGAPA